MDTDYGQSGMELGPPAIKSEQRPSKGEGAVDVAMSEPEMLIEPPPETDSTPRAARKGRSRKRRGSKETKAEEPSG